MTQTSTNLTQLDDDDAPVGRVLSRREVLALLAPSAVGEGYVATFALGVQLG